ncbi:hypothetical protein BC332_04724 [Capsicum chinense]|nr:hypothetical protein BC332_04724 [Capsicum chinense]
MAGVRKEMMSMNGVNMLRRVEYGRPIPKRGQVKLTIALELAQSLSSIFSNRR